MAQPRLHHYRAEIEWTGNRGRGTDSYTGYGRDHVIRIPGRPEIAGSADAAFRGDGSRVNPEDMLLAAVSACHMLTYLHRAMDAGVVVTAYLDRAEGVLEQQPTGGGRFREVVLRPTVTISRDSSAEAARQAHVPAHHACFVANSVNFPIRCEPEIVRGAG